MPDTTVDGGLLSWREGRKTKKAGEWGWEEIGDGNDIKVALGKMVDKKHLQMPQRQLITPKISERDFRVRILLQAELGREYSQAWRMKSR